MRCQHCNTFISSIGLDADQGTTTVCPHCQEETKVRYTFRDCMRDPSIVPFGNTKYLSKPIQRLAFVCVMIFFAILFLVLIGVLTGHVTVIN